MRARDEVFRVTAAPGLFGGAGPVRRYYAATMRRAKRWARIYLRTHPCGEAVIHVRTRRHAR